jgi:ketosteroid isomerase-like protein
MSTERAITVAHQRAPHGFTNIHDIVSEQELAQIATDYAAITGLDPTPSNRDRQSPTGGLHAHKWKESPLPATTLEQLHLLFDDAVNAHDLDALMDLYEPDPIGADLDGKTLRGSTAMRQFLAELVAVARSIETTTSKAIATDNVGLLSGRWVAHICTPDGEELIVEGSSAEVARRQPDGTWRFIIDDPLFTSETMTTCPKTPA